MCDYRTNLRGNLLLHLRKVHKLNVESKRHRVTPRQPTTGESQDDKNAPLQPSVESAQGELVAVGQVMNQNKIETIVAHLQDGEKSYAPLRESSSVESQSPVKQESSRPLKSAVVMVPQVTMATQAAIPSQPLMGSQSLNVIQLVASIPSHEQQQDLGMTSQTNMIELLPAHHPQQQQQHQQQQQQHQANQVPMGAIPQTQTNIVLQEPYSKQLHETVLPDVKYETLMAAVHTQPQVAQPVTLETAYPIATMLPQDAIGQDGGASLITYGSMLAAQLQGMSQVGSMHQNVTQVNTQAPTLQAMQLQHQQMVTMATTSQNISDGITLVTPVSSQLAADTLQTMSMQHHHTTPSQHLQTQLVTTLLPRQQSVPPSMSPAPQHPLSPAAHQPMSPSPQLQQQQQQQQVQQQQQQQLTSSTQQPKQPSSYGNSFA